MVFPVDPQVEDSLMTTAKNVQRIILHARLIHRSRAFSGLRVSV